MKKLLLIIMCLLMLCAMFSITAFAAESDSIIIEKDVVDGQQLENGHTYVFGYYPNTLVSGSGKSQVAIVRTNGAEVVYFNRYNMSDSTLYAVQPSNSTMEASNTVVCVNRNYSSAWTSDCFEFNVSSPSEINSSTLVVITMTVPDDGKVYKLNMTQYAETTYLRVLERIVHDEHVYDNTCDSICNECNRERTITHTYADDNDHNCSICGYENPEPTHMYVANGNHNCSVCGYENPEPTHVYKNKSCVYCGHKISTNIWLSLKTFSLLIWSFVVGFVDIISKNLLLVLSVVGIPLIGFLVGLIGRLFSQRI